MDHALEQEPRLRVAVEGCGHGTLNAIYASVDKAREARGWDGVDLLIIGGDFQAVRNASDLTVMSCPVKYREIGDFHAYYSGTRKAPYLTIFVGGNHEASSHLWELYYGGWVAPNIYYMGAANVVQVGGVRIAGMSGIWKGYNYNRPHHERLPYNQDDIKSIYHVRELDIRKLLQLRTQVDIGISHDWPRAIERHGNQRALFNAKPDFEQESKDGTLGNLAAAYVMDRLRPPYWFAAHMHCKFAATKIYEDDTHMTAAKAAPPKVVERESHDRDERISAISAINTAHNADEIDLDLEDDSDEPGTQQNGATPAAAPTNSLHGQGFTREATSSSVPNDLRSQLPMAFQRPAEQSKRLQPGQPSPPDVRNKSVRFLALDKCLPGRKFLQLLEIQSNRDSHRASDNPIISLSPSESEWSRPKFEYDPEWLSINRVFAADLILGDKSAVSQPELGEEHYGPLIARERAWINENIVKKGKLAIPDNFETTAPPFVVGTPEIVDVGPREYSNPQMQTFCELIGIENKFSATEEERNERLRAGPAPAEERGDGRFSRGRGRGRGGGGRGRGGNRGGRGSGRGRGRGW